jgi:prevent-host-death family protein
MQALATAVTASGYSNASKLLPRAIADHDSVIPAKAGTQFRAPPNLLKMMGFRAVRERRIAYSASGSIARAQTAHRSIHEPLQAKSPEKAHGYCGKDFLLWRIFLECARAFCRATFGPSQCGANMHRPSRIKSISYLKANAAEVLHKLTEEREPLVITQNGEAKAVIQDVASYEQTQETLALLKILALGNRDIEAGKFKQVGEVVNRLRSSPLRD